MNAKETLATPSKRALSFEAAKSFFLALWGIAAVTLAILYTAVLGIFAAAAAACGGEVLVSYIAKLWSIMILRTCGIRGARTPSWIGFVCSSCQPSKRLRYFCATGGLALPFALCGEKRAAQDPSGRLRDGAERPYHGRP